MKKMMNICDKTRLQQKNVFYHPMIIKITLIYIPLRFSVMPGVGIWQTIPSSICFCQFFSSYYTGKVLS